MDVFPALAGVFPVLLIYMISNSCIPRTSGGVSLKSAMDDYRAKYSPH